MRKADFAESILSLTTTPERAASTAGDLAEESAERGNLWFWTSLIRTTVSLVWRTFADAPLQMMGLAAKAFLMQAGAFLAVSIAAGIVLGVLIIWGKVSADVYKSGISIFTISIGVMASDFLIGLWMSRRARGRELAGWVNYIVITTLFFRVLLPLIFSQVSGTFGGQQPAFLDPMLAVAETLSFFAGVKRERRSPPRQLTSR